MKTLDQRAKEIRDINKANGFNVTVYNDWSNDPYKIPAILALIHSEVSEALEEFRAGNIESFLTEMADVYIRTLDCVGGFTADFEFIVNMKLEENKNRAYKHGGKRI